MAETSYNLTTVESVKKWCGEVLSTCSPQMLHRLFQNICENEVDGEVLSLVSDDGEEIFTKILFGPMTASSQKKYFPQKISHAQDVADYLAARKLFRMVRRLKFGGWTMARLLKMDTTHI